MMLYQEDYNSQNKNILAALLLRTLNCSETKQHNELLCYCSTALVVEHLLLEKH